MAKLIQPSLAGGEVSPAIGARVDLSKRQIAVEHLDNFVVDFTGSASSRPGQYYVARCKNVSGNQRIIEFEFNTEQTFVLELGNLYMRFHTLGSQILDTSTNATITGATAANPVVVTTSAAHGYSNGDDIYISGVLGMTELNGRAYSIANVTATTFELQTLDAVNIDGTGYTAYSSAGTSSKPYELTTVWPESVLYDLDYAQSGDILTIVHPDYEEQELIRITNDNWTLTSPAFAPSQDHPDGVVVNEGKNTDNFAITNITQADPPVVTTATHGWSTDDEVYIYGVSGMPEINNTMYSIVELSTTTFELYEIDSGQTVDATGFGAYTSGGTAVEAVRPRFYSVTAINRETGEESLRGHSPAVANITAISTAKPAVVTVDEGHGFRNLDTIVLQGMTGADELEDLHIDVIRLNNTQFEIYYTDGTEIDGSLITAWSSGGSAYSLFSTAYGSLDAEWDNKLTWTAVADADSYNVYSSDGGSYGFVGLSNTTGFRDRNIEGDTTTTFPTGRDPFRDATGLGDNFPGAVGFFNQRRVFGNTNDNPNRFFMTQPGHFYNFSRSSPGKDDDAIIADIAARRVNAIQHILPLSDLILLTAGGEYRLFSQNGVITPKTIEVKPQSYYGSLKLRPIVAGNNGLFATPGNFIRDFQYSFADDKFVGKDLTVLARHLFVNSVIVDWDFAPSPYGLGWVVRDDGSCLSMTYQPEQEVYAWGRATTKGSYKSVSVIREDTVDTPYFIVERTIAGVTSNYIERQDSRKFKTLSEAFCVDCGLSLNNPIDVAGYTVANPTVITTSSAHGLTDGDYVDISGVYEVDTSVTSGKSLSGDINGTGYIVANSTATTFEIAVEGTSIDGSAFSAYSSGGEAREAVTTVSGLWHLEGETVVAAGNGYAEAGKVVSNGQVTLDAPASIVHVGLPYTCKLRTLPLSTYSKGQDTQGRVKNINRLTVQLERAMGMWFGPSEGDDMREARFGLPEQYGQPLELKTEDIDVTMKAQWAKTKQIVIEQRSPLPLTIRALIPDVSIGGN